MMSASRIKFSMLPLLINKQIILNVTNRTNLFSETKCFSRLCYSKLLPFDINTVSSRNTSYFSTFTLSCKSQTINRAPALLKRLKNNNTCLESQQVRRMAGHSKWQNVKHIKAEKNALKGKLCDKYVRLARYAVKEGGSDPKVNTALKNVLDEAHKFNVPMSTLERAMKAPPSTKSKTGFLEIAGPGGLFIILDYETDNISTARHEIKIALRKYGSNIMAGEGRWRAVYEKKGIVRVTAQKNGTPLSAEVALDSAILAGAEDVKLKTDDDNQDKTFLEFLCDPDDVHLVNQEIKKMEYIVEEAYVGFIPNTFVALTPQDEEAAANLIVELENLSSVVHLYENAE